MSKWINEMDLLVNIVKKSIYSSKTIGEAIDESQSIEVVRCKDCKYFEYDHVENVDGIPLIVAHEICTRWSDGVKTSENGYCFLGERGEADDE